MFFLKLWMLSPFWFDVIIIAVFLVLLLFFSWIVAIIIIGIYLYLRGRTIKRKK